MPYALIPDGFTLKKVTKQQKDAVKEFRRHENVKVLLDNETTLPVILGPVLVPLIAVVISELLKELPNVPKDYFQSEGLKQRVDSILTTLQFKRQEGTRSGSGRQGETVRAGEASEDFIWADLFTKNPFFGYEPPVRRETPVRR